MNILVIRFSSLGDVVLSIGALRAIAHVHPDARLTFLTKPKYQFLLEDLDISVHVPILHPERLLSSARQGLQGTRFDCIVDLHGSLRSIALSRVLRAARRLRVKKYTARRKAMVKRKEGLDQPLSVLQAYHEAIELFEPGHYDVQPRLFLSDAEASHTKTLRSVKAACLGIGWGARWPTKAVPQRIWHALLAGLNSDSLDSIRIFGMESDRQAIETFLGDQDLGGADVHVECGHSIREVMTRLAACNAFISSDSGLMHIAAALGVPTIGLFGPTHPALGFAPVGDDATHFHAGTYCSPCHRHGTAPCFREHRFCFDELDISAITESVRAALIRPWSLPNVTIAE